jgi:hypothetical protein
MPGLFKGESLCWRSLEQMLHERVDVGKNGYSYHPNPKAWEHLRYRKDTRYLDAVYWHVIPYFPDRLKAEMKSRIAMPRSYVSFYRSDVDLDKLFASFKSDLAVLRAGSAFMKRRFPGTDLAFTRTYLTFVSEVLGDYDIFVPPGFGCGGTSEPGLFASLRIIVGGLTETLDNNSGKDMAIRARLDHVYSALTATRWDRDVMTPGKLAPLSGNELAAMRKHEASIRSFHDAGRLLGIDSPEGNDFAWQARRHEGTLLRWRIVFDRKIPRNAIENDLSRQSGYNSKAVDRLNSAFVESKAAMRFGLESRARKHAHDALEMAREIFGTNHHLTAAASIRAFWLNQHDRKLLRDGMDFFGKSPIIRSYIIDLWAIPQLEAVLQARRKALSEDLADLLGKLE